VLRSTNQFASNSHTFPRPLLSAFSFCQSSEDARAYCTNRMTICLCLMKSLEAGSSLARVVKRVAVVSSTFLVKGVRSLHRGTVVLVGLSRANTSMCAGIHAHVLGVLSRRRR
jgi:hypothetical protein